MIGTIFRLFPSKGFAFIRDSEGNQRFAHAREFKPVGTFDHLREGQAVDFTPTDDGPKTDSSNGLRATKIKVLEC